jgi:hypothetical protein
MGTEHVMFESPSLREYRKAPVKGAFSVRGERRSALRHFCGDEKDGTMP